MQYKKDLRNNDCGREVIRHQSSSETGAMRSIGMRSDNAGPNLSSVKALDDQDDLMADQRH